MPMKPTFPRKSYLTVQQSDGKRCNRDHEGGGNLAPIFGFPTVDRALDEVSRLKAIDAEEECRKNGS